MNIKILDSWLRDYLKTNATPQQIAEKLSLTSVSIEHIEPYKNDFTYDIEVTTNRPDLMSIIGLAREAATILPQFGIPAEFLKPTFKSPSPLRGEGRGEGEKHRNLPLTITNTPDLINRICAVVMEVKIKPTPQHIKDRLESSDIRSLNNLIDVTNYVMRVTGHPTHVMDYDRLTPKTIRIRQSKKGEKIKTLDNKTHTLSGWDIVADNGQDQIIDLPGVMGIENSVVTDETKRIIFFINNDNPHRVRRTSMTTGIRTEAAVLNEKGLDPELAHQALIYGINLYQELADGKLISDIIDIYPNPIKPKTITVSSQKINQIIGIQIPIEKSQQILQSLGFNVIASPSADGRGNPHQDTKNESILKVTPPSFRADDIQIEEDIIEEIARIYGYHNIPNILPPVQNNEPTHLDKNEFYWEKRIKEAFKYWGFTETYTNSMVSEDMFQGSLENAVAIQNPLTKDMAYMRNSLIPSLTQVTKENKNREEIKIFEIGNIYHQTSDLPSQTLHLSALVKKPNLSFFEIKGLLEQLTTDLGIKTLTFQPQDNNMTVKIHVIASPSADGRGNPPKNNNSSSTETSKAEYLGEIQILDENLIAFELNLQTLLNYATLHKIYTPASKFPAIYEDLSLITPPDVSTGDLIQTIQTQSPLIQNVSLLDKYQNTRTFHITYQSHEKNLTTQEVENIRTKILTNLKTKLNTKLKE